MFFSGNASLQNVGITCAAIFPTILSFSLPLSFLIGILIGISGLKGDNQITALNACGVPARRLLRVLLILGSVVGVATGVMTAVVVPETNLFLKEMKEKILLSQAPMEIQPRVFNDDLPDKVFYLEDMTADRKIWSRVFMASETDTVSPSITLARQVTWFSVDKGSDQRIQLHFEDGARYSLYLENPGKDQVTKFISTDIPIQINESQQRRILEKESPKKEPELSTHALWKRARDPNLADTTKALVELNQRIALPFSVFPFAVVGLSLAVTGHKGGRTAGFVLSLIVVLFFYILFVNGIRLAKIGEISPWLGTWAADILLGCLGMILLARTEWRSGRHLRVSVHRWKPLADKIGERSLERLRSRISRLDNELARRIGNLPRFLFPKLFDLYIAKGFLHYFLWSLVTCSLLFMLLTMFELLDDVIRNETPVIRVVEYFTYLVPQVLVMAIPMSILLGVLINFGILEKNSEVTAMKAGGWSLYRISMPILLMAAAFCVGLFLIQDYILPTSNERQDQIWSSIKGRPPQTTMLQRKWILGESGRIYNYEHFDEKQDVFVGLNIYETDLGAAEISRIVRASRAIIDPNGLWKLEKGWIRNFNSGPNGFARFETETLQFPEKADYFKKEIFQPTESSKMTYRELMSHIEYLMKSGYNAVELQVNLKKKIAFPFSSLVMAMLAIPFSFIIGKRGAFFGIGASIAIAILFLMVSGFFESMGTYGILTPFLAAWAPNIIFGAAGFWMLLSVRT